MQKLCLVFIDPKDTHILISTLNSLNPGNRCVCVEHHVCFEVYVSWIWTLTFLPGHRGEAELDVGPGGMGFSLAPLTGPSQLSFKHAIAALSGLPSSVRASACPRSIWKSEVLNEPHRCRLEQYTRKFSYVLVWLCFKFMFSSCFCMKFSGFLTIQILTLYNVFNWCETLDSDAQS